MRISENKVVDELTPPLKVFYKRDINDATAILKRLKHSGAIEKFRGEWSLPLDGFSSWIMFEKWWNTFIIPRANKWIKSKECKKLEKQQKQTKLQSAREKIGREIILHNPIYRFEIDIDGILNTLKISERFRDYIKGALVTKKSPYLLPKSKTPEPKLAYNQNTRRNELWVRVWAETTQKDFESPLLWHRIGLLKRKLHDYKTLTQRTPNYLSMHEQMYLWHFEHKLSYRQVIKRAKEEFGYNVKSEQDLSKILERYKKRVGIPTRKRRN